MGRIFRKNLEINLYISLVPLIILPVLTTADVVARYIFNSSINSTLEICSLCLSMCVSLALANMTYERENFSVTFLMDRFSARVKKVLNIVTSFISAGICYVLVIPATRKAIYSLKTGEYAGGLEVPVYPAKLLFAFGFLMVALVLTTQFLGDFYRDKGNHSGGAKS